MADLPKGVTSSRRDFLTVTAAVAAAATGSRSPASAQHVFRAVHARDRFWVWAHPAGSHNEKYGLPGTSRMTPLEAAVYLGTPNAILCEHGEEPKPPFDQYAIPLRALKRVVWSVRWARGTESTAARRSIRALAENWPGLGGVVLDDFLVDEDTERRLPINQLREIRKEFELTNRRLDLWAVAGPKAISKQNRPHVDVCDVIALWIRNADELDGLEAHLDNLERNAPDKRRVLGCFLWDYDGGREMPLDRLKRQYAVGFRRLMNGRLHGMVFLTSCVCDLGLEAVEYTRRWIAEVGGQAL